MSDDVNSVFNSQLSEDKQLSLPNNLRGIMRGAVNNTLEKTGQGQRASTLRGNLGGPSGNPSQTAANVNGSVVENVLRGNRLRSPRV